VEVRDPIHGAIALQPDEAAIVDHPFLQRLRNVRQTGFSHLPFPGATHTRYAHSLGVFHLAGRAFDHAFRDTPLPAPVLARFRDAVRLAALCHDLGHAPFSHCTEFAMPPLSALGLSWYRPHLERRASHEDYTIAILAHTDLAALIGRRFACTARHVAALIESDVVVEDDFFVHAGVDWRRALAQIVSSELDVDRLDYLVRDAYYTGARYGEVDVSWLISNLTVHVVDDRASLALDSSAIYAFDDFLVARHHMFLMVYFHHKSVVYEEMLKRWVTSAESGWSLPSDLDAYLREDDLSLEVRLRNESSGWARRIVERRPYRRIIERHGSPEEVDLHAEEGALAAAGIDVLHAGSTGKLSRYNVYGQKRDRAPQIYVFERVPGLPVERITTLEQATAVFNRYADARRIARLYVAPEQVADARAVLGLPS
jgi:hypothetical protein